MTRLLAVAGVLAISFSAIFFRLAAVSPATAAFFRTGYAVPVLLLIWALFRRGQDRRRRSDRLVALGAGLLLALDLVLWHRAIELIGAGLGTVLANVQVVFVGLAAWVIHRERPTLLAVFMVPLVFAGVALISGLGRADAYGADPKAGVLFGVAAGASYAGFLLAIRASNRVLAPPAGPLLDATFGAMLGTVAFGAVDPDFSLRLAWPAHGWLLALALLVQVFGWLLVTRALPRLPALETSVMLLLQPMATVLWAFLLFAERLATLQWIGVLLVLGGVGTLMALGSARGPLPDAREREGIPPPELVPGP